MNKRVESMQIGVDEVCRLRDTIRTLEEQLAAKDAEIEWLNGQVKAHWKLAEIRREKLEHYENNN